MGEDFRVFFLKLADEDICIAVARLVGHNIWVACGYLRGRFKLAGKDI